jgi:hypothetical protein
MCIIFSHEVLHPNNNLEQNRANRLTEQKNYKFIERLNTENLQPTSFEQNGAKTTRVQPSTNIILNAGHNKLILF